MDGAAREPHSVPKLQNAHVLITGGSSGIGLATARLALARGARVSLIARRPDDARRSRRLVARRPAAQVAVAAADVSDVAQVDVAVSTLTDALGPVDIAICSAGQARPGYFEQLDPDLFRSMMDVNYFGTVNVVRAVLPGDDGAAAREHRRRVVGGRARRRVRLHRVRADEVRGARLPRVVAGRDAAVRYPRGLLVPARHRHAPARRREPVQAEGDEGDLGHDQAAVGRARRPRASSRASRRSTSRSSPTRRPRGLAKIAGLAPGLVSKVMDRPVKKAQSK